jgi:hypothetical protein
MRAHMLKKHTRTFGPAGNLISKANVCPSTAALHGATLQPASKNV